MTRLFSKHQKRCKRKRQTVGFDGPTPAGLVREKSQSVWNVMKALALTYAKEVQLEVLFSDPRWKKLESAAVLQKNGSLTGLTQSEI